MRKKLIMSDTTEKNALHPDALPEPVIDRRRWRSSYLIWVLPVVALIIGIALAVQVYLDKGPVITISFKSGEGIEAGKTKIKYKDVQIGLVKSVTISKDRSSVLVAADVTADAERFLKTDTRFWVVKPRITGSSVSGLSTLTAGTYIAMDVGTAKQAATSFVGLDNQPAVTMDVPGRRFVLHTEDVGSLSAGSPLFYRHLQVGEVLSVELDKDGETVLLHVFVRAPYDSFVRNSTVFWQASGVDFKLDANGLKVNTESMVSILMGGIAFQTPEEADNAPQADQNRHFMMYSTRDEALKRLDSIVENYRLVFRESVRGLTVGAPVDLRGLTIGEVTRISAELDPGSTNVAMGVNIRFYPDRLRGTRNSKTRVDSRTMLNSMIKQGLRAQLRSGSLLTGQLYVALDYFPDAPAAAVNWSKSPAELPTMAGIMAQFQTSLMKVVQRLEKVPFDELANDTGKTVRSLDASLKSADKLLKSIDGSLVPEARKVLEETRSTLQNANRTIAELKQGVAADSGLQLDLRDTMRELGRAAQSLRTLGDYLERNPEALLRGKQEDPR